MVRRSWGVFIIRYRKIGGVQRRPWRNIEFIAKLSRCRRVDSKGWAHRRERMWGETEDEDCWSLAAILLFVDCLA